MEENIGISIVLEGLDGVGKSITAAALADRIGAQLLRTPPEIMRNFRSYFDREDNITRKAYYMVGNFIAGNEIRKLSEEGKAVVIDRYYASTIAYVLGKSNFPLPDLGDVLFEWPKELYRPKYMIVLILPEIDRISRRQSRLSVPETDEEKMLSENPEVASRINQAYIRLGCIPVQIKSTDSIENVVDKVLESIKNI